MALFFHVRAGFFRQKRTFATGTNRFLDRGTGAVRRKVCRISPSAVSSIN